MTEALRNLEAIQSYLADRLPEAECAALEKRLLTDVELVRDVETSLRLREGLERLRDQKALRALIQPRRTTALWGAAGAAVAALAAVGLYLEYFQGYAVPVMAASLASFRTQAGSPLNVAGQHSFALMRSANALPTVTLPSAGALELRVLTTARGNGDSFRVALDEIGPSATTSRIGVVDHVLPDADGFVAIYVDAGRAVSGDYVLDVQSEAAGSAPAEHFEFRLRRPDPVSQRGE